MDNLLVLFTFLGSVAALLFAVFTAKRVLNFSEGTDTMKKKSHPGYAKVQMPILKDNM